MQGISDSAKGADSRRSSSQAAPCSSGPSFAEKEKEEIKEALLLDKRGLMINTKIETSLKNLNLLLRGEVEQEESNNLDEHQINAKYGNSPAGSAQKLQVVRDLEDLV